MAAKIWGVRARAQAKKAGELGDAEFLRLAAEEAEFARAKERLTLKHRNTSQWARRALKRGINVTDEGVRRQPSALACRWDALSTPLHAW